MRNLHYAAIYMIRSHLHFTALHPYKGAYKNNPIKMLLIKNDNSAVFSTGFKQQKTLDP